MKVPPSDRSLEELREELDRIRRPLRIAVVRPKNPFNVGAIIRVAHSFLVREIILVGKAPYYERAAMGMAKFENIREVDDESALIRWARDEKLPIVVLERDGARESLWTCPLPAACLMVFGAEDFGVGAELIAAADQVVGIPMYGLNHSFPLSVAAGIAMAEWTRRHVEQPTRGGA